MAFRLFLRARAVVHPAVNRLRLPGAPTRSVSINRAACTATAGVLAAATIHSATRCDTSTEGEAAPGQVRRVVILVAMEEEAEPFIRVHGLTRQEPSPFLKGAPMVAFRGEIGKPGASAAERVQVYLVWNGRDVRYKANNVATTAAAVSTYASIAAFQPDLVISAGTAGGLRELGATIGAVYLSTKCVYHSRRIPEGDAGLEEYGFGHFRSPPLALLAKRAGLKQGVVSTADSLDCSSIDLEMLRCEGAVVKEMEAAACAWVCQQFSVPFIALKAITDIVDGGRPTEKEFYENLQQASEALQGKLTQVLELLANSRLSEWRAGR